MSDDPGSRPSPGHAKRGLRFAGYAAIFDRPDRGGDIVRTGAFARSLKRAAAGAVPLLWQHRPGRPIGRIDYLKEDRRGLRVIGRLSDGAAGREAAALLKEGAVRGLSFGYRVRAAAGPSTGSGQAGPRELTELELVEISLVTLPMQPRARVHALEGQGSIFGVCAESPPLPGGEGGGEGLRVRESSLTSEPLTLTLSPWERG